MSSVVHVEIQQNPAHITVIPFKTEEKKNNNHQKNPTQTTNPMPNQRPLKIKIGIQHFNFLLRFFSNSNRSYLSVHGVAVWFRQYYRAQDLSIRCFNIKQKNPSRPAAPLQVCQIFLEHHHPSHCFSACAFRTTEHCLMLILQCGRIMWLVDMHPLFLTCNQPRVIFRKGPHHFAAATVDSEEKRGGAFPHFCRGRKASILIQFVQISMNENENRVPILAARAGYLSVIV